MAEFQKEAEKVKGDLAAAADVIEVKPKSIVNFVGILVCIAVVAVITYAIFYK